MKKRLIANKNHLSGDARVALSNIYNIVSNGQNMEELLAERLADYPETREECYELLSQTLTDNPTNVKPEVPESVLKFFGITSVNTRFMGKTKHGAGILYGLTDRAFFVDGDGVPSEIMSLSEVLQNEQTRTRADAETLSRRQFSGEPKIFAVDVDIERVHQAVDGCKEIIAGLKELADSYVQALSTFADNDNALNKLEEERTDTINKMVPYLMRATYYGQQDGTFADNCVGSKYAIAANNSPRVANAIQQCKQAWQEQVIDTLTSSQL